MRQMQQDISTLATASKPVVGLPPVPSLDDQIATLFDSLKATPNPSLHAALVELIHSKRTAVINGLQFDTLDNFIAKSKVVTQQFEEMLQTAENVLKAGDQK